MSFDVPRSILLRLADIRDAINGIRDVTGGMTFDAFSSSWVTQRAVERGLEIISEASRHVPGSLKELAPHIPWRQIAAIGNLLRHEYQRADVMATWNIIELHLPALAVAVEMLIMEQDRRDKGGAIPDRQHPPWTQPNTP